MAAVHVLVPTYNARSSWGGSRGYDEAAERDVLQWTLQVNIVKKCVKVVTYYGYGFIVFEVLL
eukprot:5790715-Amphidinium_carterae.1